MRTLSLLVLLVAASAAAEDPAAHRAEVEATLGKAVSTIADHADRGVSSAESALLLRASGLLRGDQRERAHDALVRAWDAKLERPQDATAIAADADRLDGLLDAWQASGDERFRQAATEALGRAAVDAASKDHPPAADLARLAAGLARGGAVLASPEATAMARRAEHAAAAALGEQPNPTEIDALAHAALELYEHAGDMEALQAAVDAQDRLDQLAWDEAAGAYKNPAPFGALDLVVLGRVTDDDACAARARRLLTTAREKLPGDPLLLCAAAEDAAPVLHITLIGRTDEPATATLLAAAHRREIPGFAITTLDGGEVCTALRKRFPGMPLMPRKGGAPTAYLCTDAACDPPTTDPEALARRIGELAGR